MWRFILLIGMAGLLVTSGFALAQDNEEDAPPDGKVKIQQAVTVMSAPMSTSHVVAILGSGTEVRWIAGIEKSGFYRVDLPGGGQGWISTTSSTVSEQPVASLELAARNACEATLEACPINGCSAVGSPHALFNSLKKRVPSPAEPIILTFRDFQLLQSVADDRVGEKQELDQEQRATLQHIDTSRGSVSEGDVVEITGFIASGSEAHANTGESVNCNLSGKQNNDFHITIANSFNDTEFEGIVVEMIPQDRPSEWSLGKLKAVREESRAVLVLGALFYDNEHRVNADASNPLNGEPKRFSLWEVHPITEFKVCREKGISCDPKRPDDWISLGDFQPE